jgi:hypothetical protein
LPEHEDIAPAPPDPAQEFELGEDSDDLGPPVQPGFEIQAGNAVRQTPLDPADHLEM